jgi:uncharacterized protein (DUF4415 family)
MHNDNDNPEWSEQEFQKAAGFKELSEDLQRKIRRRGVGKTPLKERVTLRLSPEVTAYFRQSGKGWSSRINEAPLKIVKAK